MRNATVSLTVKMNANLCKIDHIVVIYLTIYSDHFVSDAIMNIFRIDWKLDGRVMDENQIR